jgi:hypothetical protein
MESQEGTNQRLNLHLQQNNGTVNTFNLLRIKLSFEKEEELYKNKNEEILKEFKTFQ